MTASAGDELPPLERAERLVERMEKRAGVLARSAAARTVEVAEDVWAEARDLRRARRPQD